MKRRRAPDDDTLDDDVVVVDIVECYCGRGNYNAAEYASCYACYLERRADYVVCIECGVRWHGPEYALCYQCNQGGGIQQRRDREEASRTLRQEIMLRDNFECRHCGGRAEQIDHIKPCKWGGNAWPWNLQALCTKCNAYKGATWWDGCPHDDDRSRLMLDYFFFLRGFLNDDERAALKVDVNEWRRLHGHTQPVRSL